MNLECYKKPFSLKSVMLTSVLDHLTASNPYSFSGIFRYQYLSNYAGHDTWSIRRLLTSCN